MNDKVIILGAGLFGSVLAELCWRRGIGFVLIDSIEPYRASPCAGAILKKEWAVMEPEQFDESMETLQELYGNHIRQHTAEGVGMKSTSFQTLAPAVVLNRSRIWDKVISINESNGEVFTENHGHYTGHIYSALGIWTKQFFPHVPVKGGAGSALIGRISPEREPKTRIERWAPYKQAIVFLREDGHAWFGDGTSVSLDKFMAKSYRACTYERARGLGVDVEQEIIGIRPYAANENRRAGYYERISDKCVIATGGAKVGMLLAALFAKRFIKELGA